MEFVVPAAGFIFVLASFTALERIRRDESVGGSVFLAALSFAVLTLFVTIFMAN